MSEQPYQNDAPAGRKWLPNSLKWGLAMGLMSPVLSLVGYYFLKVYPNTWADFFSFLLSEKRLLSSLTVICLLLNIGLFTLFINTRNDQTAKGIFAVTLLYAVASLLIKFLG